MNSAGIELKQAALEKAKLLDQVREVIREHYSTRTDKLKAKREAVAMLETPLPMVPVCSEQAETVRPKLRGIRTRYSFIDNPSHTAAAFGGGSRI